jgi:hypothetical protein
VERSYQTLALKGKFKMVDSREAKMEAIEVELKSNKSN